MTIMFPYLNDPSKIVPVKVIASANDDDDDDGVVKRNKSILEAARHILPSEFFNNQNFNDQFTIKTLSGGLSNALFILSRPVDTTTRSEIPQTILVRVNFDSSSSDEEDVLVDRDRDLNVMCHLASKGLAPQMYGRFVNGRLEEFYQGAIPLGYAEMSLPQYAPQIAKRMAEIHLQTSDIINVVSPYESRKGRIPQQGEIWNKLDKWISCLNELYHKHPQTKQEHVFKGIPSLSTLKEEMKWLKQQLTTSSSTTTPLDDIQRLARDTARQIVLCHMDCQSLNILRVKDEIKLIDFEYASYNAVAADIANTFCEHVDMNNLKANFHTQYPSPEQQLTFLRAYVESAQPVIATKLSSSLEINKFLTYFQKEVNQHTLISHLMWCLWSLIQNINCPLEFDFLQYASIRYEGYTLFKSKYFSNDSTNNRSENNSNEKAISSNITPSGAGAATSSSLVTTTSWHQDISCWQRHEIKANL